MIKIEKFKNGGAGTVVRNGKPLGLYVGMMLTPEEFSTLQVLAGSIVYTIDEEHVIEVDAVVQEVAPETKSTGPVHTSALEEPVMEPTAVPKIVYPNKKRK